MQLNVKQLRVRTNSQIWKSLCARIESRKSLTEISQPCNFILKVMVEII